MADETPENESNDELNLSQEQVDEFFQQVSAGLETSQSQESWVLVHEIYLGLLAGGFDKPTAIEFLVAYLARIQGI